MTRGASFFRVWVGGFGKYSPAPGSVCRALPGPDFRQNQRTFILSAVYIIAFFLKKQTF